MKMMERRSAETSLPFDKGKQGVFREALFRTFFFPPVVSIRAGDPSRVLTRVLDLCSSQTDPLNFVIGAD